MSTLICWRRAIAAAFAELGYGLWLHAKAVLSRKFSWKDSVCLAAHSHGGHKDTHYDAYIWECLHEGCNTVWVDRGKGLLNYEKLPFDEAKVVLARKFKH